MALLDILRRHSPLWIAQKKQFNTATQNYFRQLSSQRESGHYGDTADTGELTNSDEHYSL